VVELGRVKKALTNDFSWSKSRHEKLASCHRAYYFHYYQSWGGWDAAAPQRARQLYVLKKLSNRWTWGGSIVHAAIRGTLMAIRHGRQINPERLIERVHRVMQSDWAFSRKRSYWRDKHRKEFQGLVEHEYAEPVAREEWKTGWENVEGALRWFFKSRWPDIARSLKPEQWLEVDLMDFDKSIFHLDGVKIFAVPDFAYLDHDGRPVVVDWKTGQAREGYDEQVLGYALYLSHRSGLPLDQMTAALVYVNAGVEHTVSIDPGAVEGFQRYFDRSVAEMRRLLVDQASNVPLPEDAFPMTEDPVQCGRCVFRRVCGREQPRALPVPPRVIQPETRVA
jgi:CRISPR/Cas system-associated exonuclease Cas4 (RecB family)